MFISSLVSSPSRPSLRGVPSSEARGNPGSRSLVLMRSHKMMQRLILIPGLLRRRLLAKTDLAFQFFPAPSVFARMYSSVAIQRFRLPSLIPVSVLSGLLHRQSAVRKDERNDYPIKSSYKSFHSGFIDSINAIFFFREPALICFSRQIADSIDGPTS
jgi:hypothetical protein